MSVEEYRKVEELKKQAKEKLKKVTKTVEVQEMFVLTIDERTRLIHSREIAAKRNEIKELTERLRLAEAKRGGALNPACIASSALCYYFV